MILIQQYIKSYKEYFKKIIFFAGKYWIIKPDVFKNKYDIIFLFQKHDISGATRVHLDIVSLLTECSKLVVFIEHSKQDGLLGKYKLQSEVFPIKNRLLRRFYLGMLSTLINKSDPDFFFGMGSPSFYIVTGAIKNPKVKIIDINHAVSGLHFAPEDLIPRLHKRIVIDPFTKEELIKYYKKNGFSTSHIKLINNKTYLPESVKKPHAVSTSILYVGRSSVEKRVYLVAEIAKKLSTKIDFELTMIGDFRDDFIHRNAHYIRFIPEIVDEHMLSKYYVTSDILLLVSSREGFPMVIMEAMAHGVVPVCTPAGGIPYYIESGNNGFIIEGNNENEIIENAVQTIVNLNDNKVLLNGVSRNAYEYASANFSEEKFDTEYRELFCTLSK